MSNILLFFNGFRHFINAKNHFSTQNLLSDAECKNCKYKSLIISVYSSNCGGQILYTLKSASADLKKFFKKLGNNKLPSILPCRKFHLSLCLQNKSRHRGCSP